MRRRYVSIDILRGFTMFWLLGAAWFIVGAADAWQCESLRQVAQMVDHAAWNGLHFCDWLLPTLIFTTGLTIPLSFSREKLSNSSFLALVGKILRRMVILFFLGIIYNAGGNLLTAEELRYASVLGRIGFSWGLAALLYLFISKFFGAKMIAALHAFFWGGVALYTLLSLLPAPDAAGANAFTAEGSLICWVDREYLPGKLYGGNFDPEGIAGNFGAVLNALGGILAARCLYLPAEDVKMRRLAGWGIGMLLLGLLLTYAVPLNKALWTSSFLLVTTGTDILSIMFLWQFFDEGQRNCLFFEAYGRNTVFLYMLDGIHAITVISAGLFNIFLVYLADEAVRGEIGLLCNLLVITQIQIFLYRKQIDIHI